MNLHHGLNAENALKQSKIKQTADVWSTFEAKNDWLSDLSGDIFKNLSAELIKGIRKEDPTIPIPTIEAIQKRLGEHVRDGVPELAILLKRIQALMSGQQIDPSLNFDIKQNQMIAIKLYEGLVNCTAGFHDRVNDLWKGWTEARNFSERLETIREEMVQRVAQSLYDDVHAQNSVTIIAQKSGFGILSINSKDPYRGDIDEQVIINKLTSTFEKDYTPTRIVLKLEEQLFSEFHANDYKGRLNKTEAYKAGNYDKWRDILNRFFPNAGANNAWLITAGDLKKPDENEEDTDYDIIDLNWELIRENIVAQLHHERLTQGRIDDTELLFDSLQYGSPTLPALLVAFGKLDNTQKADILAKSTNDGWSLMTLAVLHQPTVVPNLLAAIDSLDDIQKVNILANNGLNLMTLAILYQPTVVPDLLAAIDTLDDTQKANILAEVALAKEINALSLAIRRNSMAVPDLLAVIDRLAVIGKLDETQLKTDILSEAIGYVGNTLMSIIKYGNQPTDLPALLAAIGTLDDTQKADILAKTSTNGRNALMLAILYQPTVVLALLTAMGTLNDNQKADILAKADDNGQNALMLSVRYRLGAVPDLLEAIGTLNDTQKADILAKADDNGQNALMLAVRYQPRAVPDLLEAIRTLNDTQKADILAKADDNGQNALMLAVRYQPGAVTDLLAAIGTLNDTQKADILAKVDNNGQNVLMFAVRYQPGAVPDLLEAIGTLNDIQKADILSKSTNDGWNLIALAVRYQPTVVSDLLAAIDTLDDTQKANILAEVALAKEINALTLAVRRNSIAVPDLLAVISRLAVIGKLDETQLKTETLSETTGYVRNGLMRVLSETGSNGPSDVAALLAAIGTLDKIQQTDILAGATDKVRLFLENVIKFDRRLTVLPALLAAIGTLDYTQKADILTATNNQGQNALMLAARYHPQAVPDLLEALATLNDTPASNILDQATDVVWSTLISAIRGLTTTVTPLIAAIGKMNNVQKAKILTQKTDFNESALALAARLLPTAVPALLDTISTLDDPQKTRILEEETDAVWTTLISAIRGLTTTVTPLIAAIGKMNNVQKAKILTQKTDFNESVLALAARLQPTVVPALLDTISTLEDPQLEEATNMVWSTLISAIRDRNTSVIPLIAAIGKMNNVHKAKILTQKTDLNESALALVAGLRPTALPALLDTISALDAPQKTRILEEETDIVWNVLKSAIQYEPSNVPPLLAAIGKMNNDQKAKILTTTTNDRLEPNSGGNNVLMVALLDRSLHVPALLGAIDALDETQKAKALTQSNNRGENALMLAIHYNQTAIHNLLVSISTLKPASIDKIVTNLVTMKLFWFEPNSSLDILRFIKDKKNTGAFIELILKKEEGVLERFTPKDWYTIVKEDLIPAGRIKSKKEVILEYIKTLDPQEKLKVIEESQSRDTVLGKFFYTQRGFFAPKKGKGTLKILEELEQIEKTKSTHHKMKEEIVQLRKPRTGTFAERLKAIDFDKNNLPKELLCPASNTIFSEPIKLHTGQIYDKKSLEAIIATTPSESTTFECPGTGKHVSKTDVLNAVIDEETLKKVEDFVKEEENKFDERPTSHIGHM